MERAPRGSRGAWRVGMAAAGTLAFASLAVGALHMPWARPLLQRVGGCPVGRASPRQVEAAQRAALHRLAGASPAPARPALGFDLGRTTLGDVEAWARSRSLSCERVREGALLRCKGVPAPALPCASGSYDDVSFGFRLGDHRLLSVTTLWTGSSPDEASARAAAAAAALERRLGPPTSSSAGAAGSFLQYRYADYLAGVTAMHLRSQGHAVREHFTGALD
jgi:hypothetical protein